MVIPTTPRGNPEDHPRGRGKEELGCTPCSRWLLAGVELLPRRCGEREGDGREEVMKAKRGRDEGG